MQVSSEKQKLRFFSASIVCFFRRYRRENHHDSLLNCIAFYVLFVHILTTLCEQAKGNVKSKKTKQIHSIHNAYWTRFAVPLYLFTAGIGNVVIINLVRSFFRSFSVFIFIIIFTIPKQRWQKEKRDFVFILSVLNIMWNQRVRCVIWIAVRNALHHSQNEHWTHEQSYDAHWMSGMFVHGTIHNSHIHFTWWIFASHSHSPFHVSYRDRRLESHSQTFVRYKYWNQDDKYIVSCLMCSLILTEECY